MLGTAKPSADDTTRRKRRTREGHHLPDRPEASTMKVAGSAYAVRRGAAVTRGVREVAPGHHVMAMCHRRCL
jgi:hypothetical protein